jgi:predicted PurR-regulated permease PerM
LQVGCRIEKPGGPTLPAGIDLSQNRSQLALPLWIVALSLLLAFCYFASSLCIIVVLAAFLAIVVEPLIMQLERLRIPRMVSAAVVIVAGTALVGTLMYGSYRHISDAVDQLPFYARRVGKAMAPITRKIEKVQDTAGKLSAPAPPKRVQEVRVRSEYPDWTTYVIRGVGPVSGVIIIVGVVPFLMFFILIQKNRLKQKLSIMWGDDIDVSAFANSVTRMVRGFVVGNLIIGASMAIVTTGVLLALKVDGAVLLGCISGLLNLIPFLGAIVGSIIPMAAALFQGEPISKLLLILLTVVSLHAIASNLLIPRIIGRRVSVSPVAATVGILFWGWLWGLIGVLLAVPLTAFVKIVADSHPRLYKIGNLLAERPRTVPPWSRATAAHHNETPTSFAIKDWKPSVKG